MNLGRIIWCVALFFLISALGCSEDSNSVSSQGYSELLDSSFAVGDSSVLEISNFSGEVTVTTGALHVVHVVAEKLVERKGDLDEIEVEMVKLTNGVRVATANPSELNNVSVDLEVTIPTDMRPSLQAGAGDIIYEGQAEGECFFATGAGSITLKLPANVNVEVYLAVGAGAVSVDFPVVGQVKAQVVDGIIGTGADGRIVAQVGAGRITVNSQ